MKVFKITYQDRNFGATYTQYEVAENTMQCAFEFGKVCHDCPIFNLVSIEEEDKLDTLKRVETAMADLEMKDSWTPDDQRMIEKLQRQWHIAESFS